MNRPLRAALLTASLAAGGLGALLLLAPPARIFEAVMWQPDCASLRRLTRYDVLGADTLVLQWSRVDDERFERPGCRIDWAALPERTATPAVILGLHGSVQDPVPQRYPELAERSLEAAREVPLRPRAYYAPLELYPGVPEDRARAYLAALPRPLWVSVYAGPGGYGPNLEAFVQRVVPSDVGVMLQDGVGVGHATPAEAARTARALERLRGRARVMLIVEAFRPFGQRFRSALPWELSGQLRAYRGLRTVAFDGGHYLSWTWVRALLAYRWAASLWPEGA
ncbi:hypothetical protein HNR42_003620 [Deinobacterium chartae]|uniref:Uncharacterized protein n=1 Tax=Deinobacterium chartae TaxID=521158 RepID=A0A841I6W4_9DEIO|nr:hypothetical protein [Deinobacterium chartae]MBB6100150.1 hypothetical protein [Deinobacterium chartae]